jgi:tetratricopeptide (TPR) repeat protein
MMSVQRLLAVCLLLLFLIGSTSAASPLTTSTQDPAATPEPTPTPEPSCEAADILAEQGDAEGAKTAYLKLLEKDGDLTCALEGLKKVTIEPSCQAADILAQQEDADGAKTAYLELLKAEPELACALEGLESVTQQTRAQRFAAWVNETSENYGGVALALAKFIAALLAIFIGVALLVRLADFAVWNLRHKQLVVEDIGNASGDDQLGKLLPGLSQLQREILIQELGKVGWVLEETAKGMGPAQFKMPTEMLPDDAPDTRLGSLVTSMTAAIPEDAKLIRAALQLLNIMFPARGTKVTSKLQRQGDTPGRLGITLEIEGLRRKKPGEPFTIWEPAGAASAPAPSSSAATGATPTPPSSTKAELFYEIGQRLEKISSLLAGCVSKLQAQKGSTTPPPPPTKADRFYEIGLRLQEIGSFDKAVSYYEEALEADKTHQGAATALAGCVSKLQVQKGADAAYAVGKSMQDAGRPNRALESYMLPLRATKHPSVAEDAWKTILGLQSGDEGKAHLALAGAYREPQAYLFDQSLAHYKLAVAEGAAGAAQALALIQDDAAGKLAKVGEILRGLAKYTDAESFLTEALARVPGHAGAQKVLAAVKLEKPPEEDKEALAAYSLGALYEEKGALDQAKTQYEKALEKKPDYKDATVALKRVLDGNRSLEERYKALLDPASRWLAIQLTKREMLAGEPTSGPEQDKYRAQTYNTVGAMNQASAVTHGDFFVELAVQDFLEAKERLLEWYEPYENLAFTLLKFRSKAKGLAGDLGRAEACKAAVRAYKQALEKARALEEREEESAERGIKVGLATAQLLTGVSSLVNEAKNGIAEVEKELKDEYEKDQRFLYGLASWYALAHELGSGVPEYKKRARRLLAYSLARSDDYWLAADRDKDFDSIRKGLDLLKVSLRKAQIVEPGLHKLVADEFSEAMEPVLAAAKWDQ